MRYLASPLDFPTTVERLVDAIEAAGMKIFARIDHAALARNEGFYMKDTLVIIYGHPRAGTPVMLAAPAAALDLPLRVLVQGDPEFGVKLFFHPVEAMLAAMNVPAALAARLAPAQSLLEQALQP